MEAVLPYIKGKTLDIGCGVGKFCEFLSKESYLGVDIDQESLEIARNNYPDFIFLHVADFACHTDLYDTIVGMAVIEHVKDPISFLNKLKKHLKPAGTIVLTTPHAAFGWTHAIGSKLGFFSKAASDEHEILFTKKTITTAASTAGLEVIKYKRFIIGVNQLIIIRSQK
jgi:2-polyprenyl-3-methyl-5-hydroxy-6-metoxy-1,4-benzoquinol methylase